MCRLSWNLTASPSLNLQYIFRSVMGLLYHLHLYKYMVVQNLFDARDNMYTEGDKWNLCHSVCKGVLRMPFLRIQILICRHWCNCSIIFFLIIKVWRIMIMDTACSLKFSFTSPWRLSGDIRLCVINGTMTDREKKPFLMPLRPSQIPHALPVSRVNIL